MPKLSEDVRRRRVLVAAKAVTQPYMQTYDVVLRVRQADRTLPDPEMLKLFGGTGHVDNIRQALRDAAAEGLIVATHSKDTNIPKRPDGRYVRGMLWSPAPKEV